MKTPNTSNIKHWNKCELYIHLREINKNKENNSFSTCLFQFRAVVARAPPGSSGPKAGPTLDRTPSHHRAHHTHTDSLRQTSRHARSPHRHIFRVWEETGAPKENPHTRGENVNTLDNGHNFFFLLINLITKQHWTERNYVTWGPVVI